MASCIDEEALHTDHTMNSRHILHHCLPSSLFRGKQVTCVAALTCLGSKVQSQWPMGPTIINVLGGLDYARVPNADRIQQAYNLCYLTQPSHFEDH